MSNNIKTEIEKIQIPKEVRTNSLLGIDKAKKDMDIVINKPKRKIRKVIYYSSAAVVLLCLITSLVFVSPTMAEIVSKVPYIGSIFKDNDISGLIAEKLEEKKYSINSVNTTLVPEKTITITVNGTKQYYTKVKEDIELTVSNILDSKGYDAFSVAVITEATRLNSNEPNQDSKENTFVILRQLKEKLKMENYDILSISIMNREKPSFEVEIPKTEKRELEIKKIITEFAKVNEFNEFQIRIYKINVTKRKQEQKWDPIITPITETLMGKKSFKVKRVGYSYKQNHMDIIINTSVLSSSSDAKEISSEIIKMVRKVILLKESQIVIKDEPYNIIVYSKDKKKIN